MEKSVERNPRYFGGRPVQPSAGTPKKTDREFWLLVIVKALAHGALSNN